MILFSFSTPPKIEPELTYGNDQHVSTHTEPSVGKPISKLSIMASGGDNNNASKAGFF